MRLVHGGPHAGPHDNDAHDIHPHRQGNRVVRLRDMEPGSVGIIRELSCRGRLRRRLMDMGIVSGTPVKVEKVAPLGDPVELKLKGFNLAVRKEESGDIWVEVSDEEQ